MSDVSFTDTCDYDLYHSSVSIVAGANMASEEELKEAISSLKKIIGTGYYDDDEGDILLNHIVEYLTTKLPNQGR